MIRDFLIDFEIIGVIKIGKALLSLHLKINNFKIKQKVKRDSW